MLPTPLPSSDMNRGGGDSLTHELKRLVGAMEWLNPAMEKSKLKLVMCIVEKTDQDERDRMFQIEVLQSKS